MSELIVTSGDQSKAFLSFPRHGVLNDTEVFWALKQPFLQSKGYALRPRLRVGWIPSWTLPANVGLNSSIFEDKVGLPQNSNLKTIDATRVSDGCLVCIKRVRTATRKMEDFWGSDVEIRVATMFKENEAWRSDPKNHCVPVLDIFVDEEEPQFSYLVMPFLRPFDDPPFVTVGDAFDFVSQTLEGLASMNEEGFIHRNCIQEHIMMDPDALYPSGYHPVQRNFDPTMQCSVWPARWNRAAVKYYFISFGIAIHWPRGYDGGVGFANSDPDKDKDIPKAELAERHTYRGNKIDCRILGNVFRRVIYEKYSNVELLKDFIDDMTQDSPRVRSDPSTLSGIWQYKSQRLTHYQRYMRLKPRQENWVKAVWRDVIHVLRCMGWLGQFFVSWMADFSG